MATTMKVFMTGASGYIGSAVAGALMRAGHAVTGLSRSAERAAELERRGVHALLGQLGEPAPWRDAAGTHELIVHTAYEGGANGPDVDRRAIEALLAAAAAGGRTRSLIFTSGIWVLGPCGQTPADEGSSTAGAAPNVTWRPVHEQLVLAGATERLATAVMRPGIVYGGGTGLISSFFETAVREGAAAFIGDGRNRMPPVHRDDLAALYVLVAERGARGIFHGTDEAAMRVADIAGAASRAAGRDGATRSIPLVEARAQMGPVADALCMDQVVLAPRARSLGWQPTHRSFAEAAPEAFAEWRAASRA
ncbi:MAG TPA: NAD-dependent epimerase/dehydratase family protein [Polyangia bacterium]|nr:NAD-dependent epimerase/dehydratase family protein [Polyangia bacterium]